MKKQGTLQLKMRIAKYFKNTFRRHSREEYREFFTRGLDDRPHKSVYPFVYARLFILFFTVFAALSLFIWLSTNRISLPTAIFFGGVLVNIPVCTLLYELNPDNDYSYVGLIFTMIIGGVVASLITTLGYFVYSPINEWVATVYTGILEESAKLVTLIAIFFIGKKRSPYIGFLLGAAVGAGFSIVEDMGYIVFYGGGMFSVSGLVVMSIVRGICSFGAHIFWTGILGFAFAIFRLRAKFWLFAAISMGLHMLWDIPIDFFWSFWVEFCCFIAVTLIAFMIILATHDFKKLGDIQLKIPVPVQKTTRDTYALRGNVITTCAALTLGSLALLLVVLPVRSTVDRQYFETYESLLEFVQDGREYEVNLERAYDEEGENYALSIFRGRVVTAEQREIFDGYECVYQYYFSYNTESGEFIRAALSGILIYPDGSLTEYYSVDEIVVEGVGCYPYVSVNTTVSSCYYDSDGGRFVAETNFRIDHTVNIIIGGVAAAIAAFYTALYVVNYKKTKRCENG